MSSPYASVSFNKSFCLQKGLPTCATVPLHTGGTQTCAGWYSETFQSKILWGWKNRLRIDLKVLGYEITGLEGLRYLKIIFPWKQYLLFLLSCNLYSGKYFSNICCTYCKKSTSVANFLDSYKFTRYVVLHSFDGLK